MDENQTREPNMIDTTDCLEAVGVFREWKNFLFTIIIISLLILQACFWLVNTGFVKSKTGADVEAVKSEPAEQQACESGGQLQAASTGKAALQSKQPPAVSQKIEQVAKQVTAANNTQPTQAAEKPKQTGLRSAFMLKASQVKWLVRFFNFVLVISGVIYCLTILFILKVSLLGKFGGINHIARAFFLSLVALVLLLPWQLFFDGIVTGFMFTPQELLSRCAAANECGCYGADEMVFYFMRFVAYWLIVVLLFTFSQIRTARWSKTTLKRLEII